MSSFQIILIDPIGVGRVRLRSIESSDIYLHKPAPTDPRFDDRSSIAIVQGGEQKYLNKERKNLKLYQEQKEILK
jgi:hypothetical protein